MEYSKLGPRTFEGTLVNFNSILLDYFCSVDHRLNLDQEIYQANSSSTVSAESRRCFDSSAHRDGLTTVSSFVALDVNIGCSEQQLTKL